MTLHHDLSLWANEACSCGGKGPDDAACGACLLYHEAVCLRALRTAAQELVGALPRCMTCSTPATIKRSIAGRACDKHKWYGAGDAADLPYAPALRKLLTLLGER